MLARMTYRYLNIARYSCLRCSLQVPWSHGLGEVYLVVGDAESDLDVALSAHAVPVSSSDNVSLVRVSGGYCGVTLRLCFKGCRISKVWLELNKVGVGWCDWEVLDVVVEGAVGDVGGEGREGVLRGERAGIGDVGFGGVPHVFCGTQGRGRRGGM